MALKTEPHFRESQLKHQLLRSQLLGHIVGGGLSPGDALPGENKLAEMMQVSRTTVRQTLSDLEREGHVHRVQGKGTFVAKPRKDGNFTGASCLCLIVPDVASGYHPSLVSGFDRAANEFGRHVVVCNSDNKIDRQASQVMRMLDQGVAGILLNPSTRAMTPPSQIRLAQRLGVPVVLLHRSIPDVSAPTLELPSEEIGCRAAQAILDAGHCRVAFVATHRYSHPESMEKGLRETLEAGGGTLLDEHVDYGVLRETVDAGYQAVDEEYLEKRLPELLAGEDRPTAVFVSYDATAEMIYLIAERMGLRVPQDLSIVCFGGADRKGAIMRRLSAVTVDEKAVALQAVKLLVDMKEGRQSIESNDAIPIELGFSNGSTLESPAL